MSEDRETRFLDSAAKSESVDSQRIYPRHTFTFRQLVRPGWTTINDLTFEFYDNGLINVKMDVYISRPQHIRFHDIALHEGANITLVSGINIPAFSYPTEDDIYLPGQSKSTVDQRIIQALPHVSRMTGEYEIWG